MEHSRHFLKVKGYWQTGLWSDARVRHAVLKNWITEQEYTEITGKTFGS